MHKCPTCDRELKELKDFPLVQIVSVERLEIPSDVVFPHTDQTLYVTDKKEIEEICDLEGYQEAPKPVVDFFNQKEQQKGFFRKLKEFFWGDYQPLVAQNTEQTNNTFEYEGWIWQRYTCFNEPGQFMRHHPNQRNVVLNNVNNYLSQLEGLFGKEVPSLQVLPNFKNDNYFKFAFEIPETGYLLGFQEEKLDSEERSATIDIYGDGPNFGSAGGPTLESLAQVARITYKGKFKQ